MKKLLFLSFTAVMLICSAGFAQQSHNTGFDLLSRKLDEYLNSAVSVYKFNGSVLIARKGNIILQKGYGYKNYANKTLNDVSSIFQIASLTKSFTAAVILKLQEEGKLSVYDKLSKYFPEQRGADEITIQNLLNHTSGIYNYTDDIGPEDSSIVSHPVSKQRVLDVFEKKPLLFKPGSKFSYCNSEYYLLGMIIEKLTGNSYENAVRKLIFEPLGMTHSGFDFINLKDTAKTSGYVTISAGKYTPGIHWDSTVTYAAGAIYSTAGDLYKWAKAIAAKQILSPNSWKQAFTPRLDNYGYGWWIDSAFNRKYIYHSGGLPGFMSYFAYYPHDDVTIILLANYGNFGDSLAPINAALSSIMFGQPYSLWEKHKHINIAEDVLKRYTGTYQFNTEHRLIITFRKGRLFVEAANPKDMLPRVELYPETETKFYITQAQLKFEFVNGADGKPTKIITYNTHGKDAEWLKVK
ncbi:MAG TPA: serine hydrolase [Mucilaginibacter sp.]|nr:serine hydrolase [Mucilaginibacter sp.]